MGYFKIQKRENGAVISEEQVDELNNLYMMKKKWHQAPDDDPLY